MRKKLKNITKWKKHKINQKQIVFFKNYGEGK